MGRQAAGTRAVDLNEVREGSGRAYLGRTRVSTQATFFFLFMTYEHFVNRQYFEPLIVNSKLGQIKLLSLLISIDQVS